MSDIGLTGTGRRDHDYVRGMERMGIPTDRAELISSCLRKGKLPDYLVRDAISSYESGSLHPDKYPWPVWVFDEISCGLKEAGIDTDFVLRIAKAYARDIGKSLPEGITMDDSEDTITLLLEQFALGAYHDRDELERTGEELRY